jgi:hypothetical protein
VHFPMRLVFCRTRVATDRASGARSPGTASPLDEVAWLKKERKRPTAAFCILADAHRGERILLFSNFTLIGFIS